MTKKTIFPKYFNMKIYYIENRTCVICLLFSFKLSDVMQSLRYYEYIIVYIHQPLRLPCVPDDEEGRDYQSASKRPARLQERIGFSEGNIAKGDRGERYDVGGG